MAIQFCPRCLWDTPMYVMKRGGVEIDYCANCRGVWLERGELDKLLEREAARDSEDLSPSDDRIAEIMPAAAGAREGGDKRQRRTGILAELFDF